MNAARHDPRDNNFNLLRLALAITVLFGHAFEMACDGRTCEPFARFTHTNLSLGEVAVEGFFLISGYLILASWMHAPRLGIYLRKRLLRIVPGYAVAAILSTVVVGLAVTHSFQYFRHLTLRYYASLLMLDSPLAGSVFPGKAWDYVNGSLWTIKYEFRCYLLVAVLGMAGLLRRRAWWMLLTLATCIVGFSPALQQHLLYHHWLLVLGNPIAIYRLLPPFMLGGCFYLLRKQIPRSGKLALASALVLSPLLFLNATVVPALATLGAYLLLYFAYSHIRALDSFKHAPDLSYGIYLYGWPVEALWTWFLHMPPLLTFVASLALCVPLAWLSWHLVERPALLLKPKSSVPVPDAVAAAPASVGRG